MSSSISALFVSMAVILESASFERCLRTYMYGDIAGGIQCASSIQLDRLDREMDSLIASTPLPARSPVVKQVVAFQTDFTIDRERALACVAPELVGDAASIKTPRMRRPRLIDALDGPTAGASSNRSFVRQWYLLAIAYNEGHGFLHAARQCVDSVPADFRHDAEVLLAQATLSEMECTDGGSARHNGTDSECDTAEQLLRAALSESPELVEAKLRLGKVLITRGRAGEATGVLATLFDNANREVAYLSRMFRGLAYERLGEFEQSGQSYIAAERVLGITSSSKTARSALAYLTGDTVAARGLLAAPTNGDTDPWLWYTKGMAWHASSYLKSLRAFALQPK